MSAGSENWAVVLPDMLAHIVDQCHAPMAELVGTSLVMRFASRGDSPSDVIALLAYSVPENPPEVVTAG